MSGQGGFGGGSPPGFGGPDGGGAPEQGAPPGFGAYAPPGAPPEPPLGGGVGGAAAPWAAGEAVSFAWARIKTDMATILGALILAGIISGIGSGLGNAISGTDPENAYLQYLGSTVGSIIDWVIGSFMAGGMITFMLKVARGEPYDFGDIFRGGSFFVNILVAKLLVGIAVVFGLALLIVPGVILALGLGMTNMLIVDRNMGAVDAMKESWRITTGHKGSLLVYCLLAFGLMLLGLLACCLGILVVIPIVEIGWIFIYLRITGQQTAAVTV